MVRLLVTGGAGFIGARCAALALESGHEVTVLDDLSTGSQSKLDTLEAAGARVVVGDVRDANARARALEGVEAVIHLAAQGSVPRSVADPEATMDVNAHATDRLLEDMAERGLQRLVLASSAAVYGDVDGLPHTEDRVGVRQSPYADSKWANEQAVQRRREQGWEAIALRFFNVYGPGQRSEGPNTGVIPIFVKKMCAGEAPILFGGGTQTRDFVHVDDVARLLVRLASDAWSHPPRAVYNVGTGKQTSLLELVQTLAAALRTRGLKGEHLTPLMGPARSGDLDHSMADLAAITADLGWHPTVALDEGLGELIDAQLGHEV
ncbi:MAG: NAD-dependent epimerase/dehydratase family protein [Candidatus Poseidoniaceae archaeon]